MREYRLDFIQANLEKLILDQYQNNPVDIDLDDISFGKRIHIFRSIENVQTIVENSRTASLPLIRNQVENLHKIDQQSIPSSSLNSTEIHSNTPSSSSMSRLSFNQPFSNTFIPHPGNEKFSSSKSKTHTHKMSFFFFSVVDCPDYNPYRNYAKYKAERLRHE